MSTPTTVPVFSPDGQLGDIPYEQLKAALAAGAKPGVTIKSPDGKIGVIPAERVPDAAKAGATVVPFEQQDGQHPGFWHALWEDAKGMAQGMASTANATYAAQSGNPMPMAMQAANMAQGISDNMQHRKDEGRSLAYRSVAPVGDVLGVNTRGMEDAADQGDVAGVAGHASAVPAAMAVSAGVPAAIELAKGGAARAALLGKTPEQAYQSALKPSTTIAPAKVARMVQTGLEQGIPVSPAGLDKLQVLMNDLNKKIANEIGTGQGKTVDPQAVAQRADAVKQKFTNQVNPTADLQAIEDSKQEFLANNQGPINAADAQAMKQGTYKQLSAKAYGEMKSATIEAQKALARGLKEELAKAFPELNELNAADGKLMDLKPVLEKAIQRQANHQLGGIGTPITAGAAKAVTGSNAAAAVTGMLKALVDNPVIKSRLAIAISKRGATLPTANARIAAYSAALGASAASSAAPDDRANEQQQ